MPSTQRFVPIERIEDDLVYLDNGSVCLVISTSAVNFALLFETEQYSIIEAFAGLLNSLSFPIQIVIRSKRLDVSSYLATLDKALEKQTNPLLSEMTKKYKEYVEGLIKENNVLDKKFFICLTTNSLELGIISKHSPNQTKKALTLLNPRKEHIVRQLSRIGLKAQQLNTVELTELFYDIYNPSYSSDIGASLNMDQPSTEVEEEPTPYEEAPTIKETPKPDEPKFTEVISQNPPVVSSENNLPSWISPDTSLERQASQNKIDAITTPLNQSSSSPLVDSRLNKVPLVKNLTSPFVVEELVDEVWPKQSD